MFSVSLNIRKIFFSERVMGYWNRLPSVIESVSLDVFMRSADGALRDKVSAMLVID